MHRSEYQKNMLNFINFQSRDRAVVNQYKAATTQYVQHENIKRKKFDFLKHQVIIHVMQIYCELKLGVKIKRKANAT